MKVIIIGSKGFIGKHLLLHFRRNGFDVWGADVAVDYVNHEKYFQIDASNSDFNSVFQHAEFDLCVNCSGAASVPESIINPLRDYYLNTVNVFRMLEAIKNHRPNCKFINLSSAAVYGNPVSLPIKETSRTIPLSPYGIHKLQSEQVCKEFYDFNKIQTCSLRIFSVYGDGLQKQLFWDLYKKAQSKKPIKLFGTGEESRDYIHVSDLVRAIELVAKYSDFKADVVNVANGEEIAIREVVSIFYSYFKENISFTFSGESRIGDPVNWKADISKLESFKYKCSTNIKEGLGSYHSWINHLDHPE